MPNDNKIYRKFFNVDTKIVKCILPFNVFHLNKTHWYCIWKNSINAWMKHAYFSLLSLIFHWLRCSYKQLKWLIFAMKVWRWLVIYIPNFDQRHFKICAGRFAWRFKHASYQYEMLILFESLIVLLHFYSVRTI